jgi:hypothetical protein
MKLDHIIATASKKFVDGLMEALREATVQDILGSSQRVQRGRRPKAIPEGVRVEEIRRDGRTLYRASKGVVTLTRTRRRDAIREILSKVAR